MHVMYLVPTLARTGVTNVVLGLVQGMTQNKVEVTVVSMAQFDVTDSVENDIRDTDANLVILEGSFLEKRRQINNLVDQYHPDVIHSNAMKADVFLASLNVKLPRVSTAHNIAKQDFVAFYGKFQGRVMFYTQLYVYKHFFDKVISVSKTVQQFWHNYRVDSAVVYNGQGMPLPVTKSAGAQHKYPLQLVWTGRITRRKRLEVILSWVHDSDLVSIEVVGNGKLYQELFEKYGGYSNIHFLGRVQDVTPFLVEQKVFVSASESEGLPMAAIEAMQRNLPLVLSDIPQHKELADDKRSGILFFNDKTEFFENLEFITRDTYEVETSTIYNERFTQITMVDGYYAEYVQLLKEED